MTKEEAAKSTDMGNFYRIAADNRDLNYEKYLEKGSKAITVANEYNSNNTKILNIEEIKEKLMTLKEVREEVENYKNEK